MDQREWVKRTFRRAGVLAEYRSFAERYIDAFTRVLIEYPVFFETRRDELASDIAAQEQRLADGRDFPGVLESLAFNLQRNRKHLTFLDGMISGNLEAAIEAFAMPPEDVSATRPVQMSPDVASEHWNNPAVMDFYQHYAYRANWNEKRWTAEN